MTQGDPNGTKATNKANPTFTDTTATMQVDLKTPGDEMTYELTVTNEGHIGGIVESIDAEATGSPAIVFSITGVNKGDKIASGESKIMIVKIQYDPAVVNQPSETTKTLKITINVVQDAGQIIPGEIPDIDQPLLTNLGNKILSDNIAYADNVASPFVTATTGIDFTKISSDTNGKGLYYTSTNTEGNKTTYYFRGNVQNNYVKFGKDKDGNELYWRIVRINEDGSIRLIYQGTSATGNGQIGKSAFNAVDTDNAHVGYMYGLTGLTAELTSPICVTYDSTNKKAVNSTTTYITKTACENAGGVWATNAQEATQANVVDSAIKQTIDTWYNKNLSSYVNYLADAGFCNNRKTRTLDNGYGQLVTSYAASYRLHWTKGGTPQFVCPQANDLFTTSTSNKGNKALSSPIGLISAEEVNYAGVRSGQISSSYIITGNAFYTMTPNNFESDNDANMWGAYGDGNIGLYYASYSLGVRPVINLKSTADVISGNGTSGSPYVIKTN